MALSIKGAEADRLVRELCRLTGETITMAVTIALRERLERVKRQLARAHQKLKKR
jgi:antitoxin VapB